MNQSFHSSAPGRLCLFGEHQDYLGLPVIAMAMNRRCNLHFEPRPEQGVTIRSREMGPMAEFTAPLEDGLVRAYPLGMALSELTREFPLQALGGWTITVSSEVPIRAGCSSSTALMTAWVAGWLQILNGGFDIEDVVNRSHRYEVLAFDGAGGNMDQFACAHGGLHRFGLGRPQTLHQPTGTFVLADSGQPKDTQGHLRRCRDARLPLMPHIEGGHPGLTEDERFLLEGTRINRDLEAHWGRAMAVSGVDGAEMGGDLTRHHAVLRDVLGLSTPRIEAMLLAARDAGAWGGKINGSGGGGCAFALCGDGDAEAVIGAMVEAGAVGAWPVECEEGVACRW